MPWQNGQSNVLTWELELRGAEWLRQKGAGHEADLMNDEQATMRDIREKFYKSWNNEETEAVKLRKESKGKEQAS